MTVQTLRWRPPNIAEMVIAWLGPLGPANGVSVERPTGAVLPFRMVNRVAGKDDKITDSATISVHTFAADYTTADEEAWNTHERMLELGPPLTSQKLITISTGDFYVDRVETSQSPVWIDYEDTSIRRFVARYEIDVRFVATA